MQAKTRRNLLLGLAAALVVAGLIVAIGSGGGGHRSKADRVQPAPGASAGDPQAAADYLGISRGELRARLRSGQSMAEIAETTRGRSVDGLIGALLARRDAALASGELSPAARQQALVRARRQIVAEANRGRGRTGQTQTAAAYIGIGVTALRARLRAGESLAQIARTRGRSRAGLIEALVSRKAARLSTAFTEHAITHRQELVALGTLRHRTAEAVDRRTTASTG